MYSETVRGRFGRLSTGGESRFPLGGVRLAAAPLFGCGWFQDAPVASFCARPRDLSGAAGVRENVLFVRWNNLWNPPGGSCGKSSARIGSAKTALINSPTKAQRMKFIDWQLSEGWQPGFHWTPGGFGQCPSEPRFAAGVSQKGPARSRAECRRASTAFFSPNYPRG